MPASGVSLIRAIGTLSQVSATVNEMLGAIQATAGALWALEVLEADGRQRLADAIDDRRRALDECGRAISELGATATTLVPSL